MIKGYHDFKIKPPIKNITLRVDREYSNIHDHCANLVWIPDHVFKNQYEMITDPARNISLKDILGLPCGRVPRGLARAFRELLDAGNEINAIATGPPVQSFSPWPEVFEVGGGVVIPCTYIVKTKNKQESIDVINDCLSQMNEGKVMKLVAT